jgi:TonB family protein
VLYELLTGKVPFDGNTDFSVKEKIVRQPPPPMSTLRPGIDPALEKIVLRAMAKDSKQRYGGCGEFALELTRYLGRRTPVGFMEWVTALAGRIISPVLGAPRVAASVAVVVILAGGAGVGLRWRSTAPPSAPSIDLITSVAPESVSQAGAIVTFGYRVTNDGRQPLRHVAVADGGPTPPVLVGGDANGNGELDPNETWQFQAQATIEQRDLDDGTLVRHVIARSDEVTSATRDVQVRLQPPPRQPGIAISTLVNGAKSVQLRAPGSVSYTYIVTNTGNVGLSGVEVRVDQGAPPTLRAGDVNGNHVLDVGERWEYRGSVTIPPAALAAAQPLVRRAFAVSDQLQSAPDEAKVTFERRIEPLRPATPPRKLRDVYPKYPAEAQAAGVQGEVRLELSINATGRVDDVRVVQSTATVGGAPAPAALQALLNDAALAAARQWEYEPTVVNGAAVPVIISASVRFVLTPRADASPQTTPQTVRVGGNIKSPVKTRNVAPVYPAIAQSARVQGAVTIEATIDTKGRVADARVLRSIPLLDQAALDAVRQWEYTPTYLNGVAVSVIVSVTVQFTLN